MRNPPPDFFAAPRRAWLLVGLVCACISLAHPAPAPAHGPLQVQIEAVSHAIAARPDDAALRLQRGELHRLGRDWNAAHADYDAAARLDPRLAEVDRCRAAAWLDAGAPGRALQAIERCVDRRPEDAPGRLLESRILGALGRRAEAVAALDRALARLPEPRPEHYLERARLVAGCGPEFRDEALRGLDAGIARLGPLVSLELQAIDLELAAGRPAAARARLQRVEAQTGPLPERRVAIEAAAFDHPGLEATTPAAPVLVDPAPTPQAGKDDVGPDPEPPGGGGEASSGPVLLARGSTWRWFANGTDLGTKWRLPTYSDAVWFIGQAPLGYGEAYIRAPLPFGPNPNLRWTTSYFRARFQVHEPVTTLALLANYDDGFVAYLNGQEVARRGLPAGPITYGTLATSHEGGAFEAIDLRPFLGALRIGTNVLAVEVHQTSLNSSDLVLDLELRTGATLTRGPYLQKATPTSAVVRWRTAIPTDSRVRWGHAPAALVSHQDDTTQTTEHVVEIHGLQPATRYCYAIGTRTENLAGGDAEHVLTTAPPPGTPVSTRIWVVGDSGLPGTEQSAVFDAYRAYTGRRSTDVWLMLGDNAYNAGTDAEYQAGLFDPYHTLLRRCVLWPTRGNHDVLYAGAGNDYYDLFTLPTAGEAGGVASGSEAYYAFDHGDIHFVCLDSEGTDRSPAGAMLTWLRADLGANTRTWTIAFWHHPPYTKGSHNSDVDLDSGGRMRDMRTNALPILDSLGVDLALTGHSHSYERSFLLDGHYGPSTTLAPVMILDGGSGRPGADGPYFKPTLGPAPHQGTVHAVSGSGSHTSGGSLNHPAMFTSLNVVGSMVLDVEGARLTARFIDGQGAVRDYFSIVKGPGHETTGALADVRTELRIEPRGPNPFQAETHLSYALPSGGPVRLTVHDAKGRRVAVLVAGERAAGRHTASWNGRDAHGRRVAAGVYFVRLHFAGQARQGKVVLAR